jgi:hypothetical protein
MPDQPQRLILTLDAGAGADDEELVDLGRRLRTELLESDVGTVDPVHAGVAPAGAKGDPVTLATLAVTLAPVALTAFMTTLQTWLSRHERASVTVERGGEKIVVTGSPSKEQQRLIETFASHHKA